MKTPEGAPAPSPPPTEDHTVAAVSTERRPYAPPAIDQTATLDAVTLGTAPGPVEGACP